MATNTFFLKKTPFQRKSIQRASEQRTGARHTIRLKCRRRLNAQSFNDRSGVRLNNARPPEQWSTLPTNRSNSRAVRLRRREVMCCSKRNGDAESRATKLEETQATLSSPTGATPPSPERSLSVGEQTQNTPETQADLFFVVLFRRPVAAIFAKEFGNARSNRQIVDGLRSRSKKKRDKKRRREFLSASLNRRLLGAPSRCRATFASASNNWAHKRPRHICARRVFFAFSNRKKRTL